MRIGQRISKRTVLVVLLAVSMVTALLGARVAPRLRMVGQYVLPPLGEGGIYVSCAVKKHLKNVTGRALPADEVRRLERENLELRGQQVVLEGEREYWRRQVEVIQGIRQSYAPIRDLPCELIPARVVAADALPYGRTRLVNGGNAAGAEPGMKVTTRELLTDRAKRLPPNLAAISATALVGRLMETGEFTARLQLVTDSGYGTWARIRRMLDPAHPRTVTIGGVVRRLGEAHNPLIDVWAQGDGHAAMTVAGVSAEENVRPGDWLVTRDDDALLPVQIRIGTVAEVRENPRDPHTVNLLIVPHADFASLREVYIVMRLGPGQQAPGNGGK